MGKNSLKIGLCEWAVKGKRDQCGKAEDAASSKGDGTCTLITRLESLELKAKVGKIRNNIC
jgi:hypothetical protein